MFEIKINDRELLMLFGSVRETVNRLKVSDDGSNADSIILGRYKALAEKLDNALKGVE